MSIETITITSLEHDEDNSGAWGHQRRKNGDQLWGVPPRSFKISIAPTVTLSPGAKADVKNIGTQQTPVLQFHIPAGERGQDYVPDRGFTGTAGGIDFKNGLAKTVDHSIKYLRSFVAVGTGINVKYEFTEAGALSIEIDATDIQRKISELEKQINDLKQSMT